MSSASSPRAASRSLAWSRDRVHHHRLAVAAHRQYTFSTCRGSNYDTRLRLLSGNHLESSSIQLANVDDACGLQSRIVMTLQPGAYTVAVEGYASREGVCGIFMPLSFDR